MRGFVKGFWGGMACICLLGLVWLFVIQPQLTAAESRDLKTKFTAIPGDEFPGDEPAGKEEPQLDLNALQAEYPDVKGWLIIPGTAVDYPVMQSSAQDPEKYLRRNYDRKWRMAGSLFFQYDCMPDSRNLVVFGHNMNDGTMFAVLKKMADPKFRQEHPTAVLQTAEGTRTYRIVTALTTDTTQLPFNRTQFAGDEDFLSFAGSMLAGTGYTVQAGDRLLTLVTCAYDWDEARTVVVAIEQN